MQKEQLMMKQLKILGLMVVAAFALGAAASGAASAVTMTLPSFSVVTGGTGTSGAAQFFGAASIKCTSGAGVGSGINSKMSTSTGEFKGCTVLGEECHSLGDKGGVILGSGTQQLVLVTLAGVDSHLVLLEGPEVHIECKTLSTLIIVKGDVLGSITGSGKTFTVKVNAKSRTEQEFKGYENDSGTIVKTQLLSSTNEGTFAESGEEAGTGTVTTEKETQIVN
jgi:hypothetical protein